MKKVVDVAVVIPSLNGITRGFIFRAIDSVYNQNVTPARFIVVDDGSTDGTAQALRARYPELEVLSKANGGLPAARNFALAQVDTQYVAYLDDDDEWLPEKLASQVRFLDENPGIGLVFCGVQYIDENGNVLGKRLPSRVGLEYPAILLGNSLLPPSTVLFRRTLMNKAGFFDETLRQGEDYEYFIRCAKYGKIEAKDDLFVRYRQHANQMSLSLIKIDEATLAIIRAHASRYLPQGEAAITRFFIYGIALRSLRRLEFVTALHFLRSPGSIWPVTLFLRFVGMLLTPLRGVKEQWRQFEHRMILHSFKSN